MNKIVTILALSCTALLANTTVIAAPHFSHDARFKQRDADFRSSREWRDHDQNNLQEERRIREERGFKRLKQHKWQTGYVMPQHYRGDGYKVEYKQYNLPKPARHQQWYKINNDYILVDSETNGIVSILGL